eukprot:gene8321-1596_t
MVLVGLLLWHFRGAFSSQLDKHPMLCKVNFTKLKYNSLTRLRLERASALFSEGWKLLKSDNPQQCLVWFAKAVEIDELACGWKVAYEGLMEKVGDLFEAPVTTNEERYASMMSEAYFIVLMHTVVTLFGKVQADVEEDLE